jgi:signal transduction histidine kinase
MLRAAEEERVRIATELHDDTVQVMAATLLSLDRFSSAIAAGDGVRMAAAVTAARETLNAAVDRTRRLTFELRPPLLEAQGLGSALRDLTETAAAEGSFEGSVAIDVGRYPELVETLTYRIAQEAITNVRKHAAAGHLWLVLREQDGSLIGEVRDDGHGFDVERALDRSAMRLHMGLDTMAERVRMAGGEVVITSAVGSGTTIGFRIPLA